MASNPLLSMPSLAGDLRRVETELLATVSSTDPALTEIAQHLILAGGKRIRPLFAVAAAACGTPVAVDGAGVDGDLDGAGGASLEVIRGGVAVELVHLGSLYHDDVIDEAVTRRTVESVNARWGNLRAILAGDFLLARASELASSLASEVGRLLAATIGRLCEGEIGELSTAYQPDRSRDAYLASIEGKTASLFATSARIGAIVGGLDAADTEALTRFGRGYGMAFQIIDDVLDLVASDEQLGKPAGHDLTEGVYTLPVLYALEVDRPGAGELRSLLGAPIHDATLDRARELVAASGGVEAALADARSYGDIALAELEAFGGRSGAATLSAATTQLWDREGLPAPLDASRSPSGR